MRTDKYINYPFESSTVLTEEFKGFSRAFKGDLNELTRDSFELVKFNRGHFYISGFLKNRETGGLVYFSIPDVRFFMNGWKTRMLIRTAENDTDYTGGRNVSTRFEDINEKALSL